MKPNEYRENIFNTTKGLDAFEIDEINKLIRVNYYIDEKASVLGKLFESSSSLFQANKEMFNKNLFNPLSNKNYKYKSQINKASNIFEYSEILGYAIKVESDKKDINSSDIFDEIANVVAGRQMANLASGMLKRIKKVNITYLALDIKTSNNGTLPIVYINALQPTLINSDVYNLALSKIKDITEFIDSLGATDEKMGFNPNIINDLIEIDETSELIKLKYKEVSSLGIQTNKYEILKFNTIESYNVKEDFEEMIESSGLLSTKGITKAASKVNPLLGKVVKTVNAVSNMASEEKEKKITKIRQVYLCVNTTILSKPQIKIQILDSQIGINSDSRQYFEIKNKLEEATSVFDRILTLNGKIGFNNNVLNNESVHTSLNYPQSINMDKFEEIKKLKELLDMDIISQEEFNRKKNELFNL